MLFLFFTLSLQFMEYTHNLTIEQLNENFDNSKSIGTDLFTYNGTGDLDKYPLSNIFTTANTYWIAKDSSTGNTKSAIFIYFKKTISLEKFLIYTAYSTKENERREYSGYPLKVNVYSSLDTNPLKIHSIFSGTEPTQSSWGKGGQFTFSEPLICDTLKLEFDKVSLDTFFKTNDEYAIINRLVLIGTEYVNEMPLQKTVGIYSDNNYVNTNMIPVSSFTYESNGDKSDKPISNAFDNKANTYWVSSTENTNSFHAQITVTFNSITTLDAILFDSAFRTRDEGRYFDGFPTTLKIYTSSENEGLKLHTIFNGVPTGKDWNRTQLVFRKPIKCKKMKIEFVEVTVDESFTKNGKKVAVTGGLTFIGKKVQITQKNSTIDDAFMNNHRIPNDYLTYSSTGEKEGHPISYAFNQNSNSDENIYWVSKDPVSESHPSSIFVNFTRTIILDSILLSHAYSTKSPNREYHGFPFKANIYASVGIGQLKLIDYFEGDVPTLQSFGDYSQYALKTPILCDSLQIEFLDVSLDKSFSQTKSAVVREVVIIGSIFPEALTLTGVFGSYSDPIFIGEYSLQGTSLSYSDPGSNSGKPISNAFDNNPKTYWVSNKENSDTYKSTITVDFRSEQTLAAILFDSAYRSRTLNNKDVRYFDGFPTTFTIYISKTGNDFYFPEAVFTGEPILPWTRTQFVFKKPITCRKMKLEFTEVTNDESFSNGKKNAVSAGIYFMKESYKLPTIPSIDSVIEVPPNRCNTHFRCDVNVTSNNKITIDLRESSFTNFNSNNNGGAISLINCGSLFEHSTFTECTSVKGGGAIYFENNLQKDNNFELINVNFINCTAVYGGAAYIYSRQAQVTIRDCQFTNTKLSTVENPNGVFYGGSALFLTVQNGAFENLKFSQCDEVIVKFYNSFNNKRNSMILSDLFNWKQKSVLFTGCKFEFDKPTDSLIYFIRGDNPDSMIKISDCEFIGDVDNEMNLIDGKVIDNKSPKLIVESCSFSSSLNKNLKFDPEVMIVKMNKKALNYSKGNNSNASWKSLFAAATPPALVLVIAIIAAVIFKRKKANDDGNEPSGNELNQI